VKTYVVGGAVRDELLGLPLKDRDHVVVGATPEEMVRQGFKPVGKDFPVFLHPSTHEEYALARTERKSGHGYKGFQVYAAPDVTLEDDLRRRDLTINAIAKGEDGTLIDPFNGKKDLDGRVLRHVSEAFAEDPVRILRVARFAARFGFRVAEDTMALMRRMVDSGETDHLVAERVWQEFSKGLLEPHPGRMFAVLEECGLLRKFLPELRPDAAKLEQAAQAGSSLAMRFALLVFGLQESEVAAVCERLKAPNEVRELALTAVKCRDGLLGAQDAAPGQLLEILKRADAFRRPARFAEVLAVVHLTQGPGHPGGQRLAKALAAAQSVDAGAIAQRASAPSEIPERVDEARRQAIAALA
jgi:tRNA nucleotidyltransferase (CCA-adding enzyme)